MINPDLLKSEVWIPVFLFDRDLTVSEILFLGLVNFYNQHDKRKTAAEVAAQMGFSPQYACKLTNLLKEKGYLVRSAVREGSGLLDVDFQEGAKDAATGNLEAYSLRYRRKLIYMKKIRTGCGKPVENSCVEKP